LRPTELSTFVGQKHLLGDSSAFRKLIESSQVPHSFFFGPPGSGKTTLSRIIAKRLGVPFFELNATTLKVEEIRKIVDSHKNSFEKPLIFIDESHRLSKTQQEVLLPIMENSLAIIVGASTENPFFALTGGIRSRSMLFEFKPLNIDDLRELLNSAKNRFELIVDEEAEDFLIHSCGGDARAMLTLLEYASKVGKAVTINTLKELRGVSVVDGVSEDETHYNLASALIKSIRGSDVEASVHYLARLICAAEEPRFIARRLAILASEDIGNANPNATILANAIFGIVSMIGYPEARIPLSQLVIYLACSPKSNRAISIIDNEIQKVKSGFAPVVPEYLKDAHYAGAKELGRGMGYKYPHDFGGFVDQEYMSTKVDAIAVGVQGFEKTLDEWLHKIRGS
jgi:putative ATPase